MVKERQDIMGVNCLKRVSGKVSVDEKGIKDSWKEYMEKLMNEENEWDHRVSAGVKEGPADCIRNDEVAAALKRMKRQSPRLVGLVSEMTQATWDIGTQWILDLQRTGSQVWYYQFTKGKEIQWSVDLTEELNCWNML